MNIKQNIIFVIPSLGAGGSERVLSSIASGLARNGYDVSIFTLNDCNPFYPLDATIKVKILSAPGTSLNIFHAIYNNFFRLIKIRQSIFAINPDVVVSFGSETNVLTLLSTIGLGIRVVVSERCDPAYYPYGIIWKMLRRLSYPLATNLVTQTNRAASYFSFMKKGCVKVIPNPVITIKRGIEKTDLPQPYILAAGRLVQQKGFDVLMNAFAAMEKKYPNLKLVVLGEGGERAALEEQAINLGIGDRVIMPGVVNGVGDYMHNAIMFVLSSRHEGFPNVLVEAMASGLAVIATDCPSGPAEIIENGVNGVLIPSDDVMALAQTMSRLMDGDDLRDKLGEAASGVNNRFSMDKILSQWESVLDINQSSTTHD